MVKVAVEHEDEEALQCVAQSKEVEEHYGRGANGQCTEDPCNAQQRKEGDRSLERALEDRESTKNNSTADNRGQKGCREALAPIKIK